MKKNLIFIFLSLLCLGLFAQKPKMNPINRTVFITGGNFSQPFIRYVIGLTHKTNPKILFIPTASADGPGAIIHWYETTQYLPMKAYNLRLFIGSSPEQKTWEEIIMDMDAIIVGGGNTLNMMAVWKAQGIDSLLKKAYEKGCVMAGGSAGSLCWFEEGITDSRPQKLSLVSCLGFLPGSHCPHYHSEPTRKPLYQEFLLKKQLKPGYACDDAGGILFQNEKYIKSVSINHVNKTYYVSVQNGLIKEEELPVTEFIQ